MIIMLTEEMYPGYGMLILSFYQGHAKQIITSGIRASDMAVRLKYAELTKKY